MHSQRPTKRSTADTREGSRGEPDGGGPNVRRRTANPAPRAPVRAMAVLALPPLIQRAVEYHLRQAGAYAMSDGWYYADAGKPVGPMTVDALADHLRTTPNSGDVDIWHSTLRTWRAA